MNTGDTAEVTNEDAQVSGLIEQPGGRVIALNGVPWLAQDIAEESAEAYALLQGRFGWLGPLMEAAILRGALGEKDCRALYLTEWGDDNSAEYSDAEKHRAYVAHIEQEIAAYQPWLVALLHAAKALILVSPSVFTFSLNTRPGAQWDAPDLAWATALTPFPLEDETQH